MAELIDEEHHAHHHGTGIPWLDVVLAGSAVAISVISLFVSVHHGHTMEKLVEANERQVKAATLPILRFSTGNVDDQQRPMVHFNVVNGGTGPAIVEWLALKYQGQPLKNPTDLVERCCQGGSKLKDYYNDVVSRQTLAPGQSQTIMGIRREWLDAATWEELDRRGRFAVDAEACFCSVLEECWVTDFKQTRPREVKSCEEGRPQYDW